MEGDPDIEKRENMKGLIRDYGIKLLEDTGEAKRPAALYIQEEAMPAAYPADAARIAIAAINGLDFIVSLNFGHIARPWTIEGVRRVNVRENYKGAGIYMPLSV
jgi:hypothetical protein